eukprot:901486-Prymnesium_polylepis.1
MLAAGAGLRVRRASSGAHRDQHESAGAATPARSEEKARHCGAHASLPAPLRRCSWHPLCDRFAAARAAGARQRSFTAAALPRIGCAAVGRRCRGSCWWQRSRDFERLPLAPARGRQLAAGAPHAAPLARARRRFAPSDARRARGERV